MTAMDDAMSGDRILERDTVFVRRCTAFEGEGIYAVRIGGVTMLRRVTVDGSGGNMILWASNPAFPPMVVTATEEPPELLSHIATDLIIHELYVWCSQNGNFSLRERARQYAEVAYHVKPQYRMSPEQRAAL